MDHKGITSSVIDMGKKLSIKVCSSRRTNSNTWACMMISSTPISLLSSMSSSISIRRILIESLLLRFAHKNVMMISPQCDLQVKKLMITISRSVKISVTTVTKHAKLRFLV